MFLGHPPRVQDGLVRHTAFNPEPRMDPRMDCHDVQDQLVAWSDGELAASAHQQLTEHLHHCSSCQRRAQRLRETTPRPWVRPPAAMQQQLHTRVRVDVIWPAVQRRPSIPHALESEHRQATSARLPPIAVAAYVALMLWTVAWSWASPRALSPAQASMPPPPSLAPAVDEISGSDYAPASYRPSRSGRSN